jgi:hypothetical protein
MASEANINDVLEGHVALEIECVDRLYLNAYVPNLQVGGQVVRFQCGHLGYEIPSTALFGRIGNRFRRDVKQFAEQHGIPILALKKPDRSRWDDRKLDHVRPHLERAERNGRFGVVAIVACQEFQWVLSARNRSRKPGVASLDFFREERRVGAYYFYILDPEFGPGFIKICTYAPWPAKVWLNGHEWAKRQALRDAIGYTELENGFRACSDPGRLQAICDSFAAEHVQAFFDRWITSIPTPLTREDRAAGYWWELSMRQVEVSRTLVLDTPAHARAFFEALVADNLGLGRPDEVSLIFDRRIRSDTQTGFATRVVTRGVDVTVNVFYRHSRIKQYLKEGRALRVETVCNSPDDLGCQRRLVHLDELQARARAANRRLLDTERAGQGCVLASPAFARVAQPSTDGQAGHPTGALRFGDPRVMALAGALSLLLTRVVGFTHRSLRAQVAALLGTPYSATQMSYDLTRLRRKGLIRRLPGRNTYILTSDGVRFALFYTRVHDRLLVPLLAADRPPAPPSLRDALHVIDQSVRDYIGQARLKAA